MSIKVIKKGDSLQAIIKNIDKIQNEHVAIGLFSKGAGKDMDKNFAMRMAHFEKGSVKAHLPARPVFQTTFNDKKSEVTQYMKFLYKELLEGNMSRKEILTKLGERYTKFLKDQFITRTFVSLSENYKVRPSGRAVTANSTPLLDTNKMRSKITHKVRM